MSFKGVFLTFLFLGTISAVLLLYYFPELHSDLEPPTLEDEYFGPGKVPKDPKNFPPDNPKIKTFQINIPNSELADLKKRLNNTRFVEPLDNVEFQYGFHASYLKEVVKYWKDKFDWRKQEQELNKFSHYKTQIEGIDVHFIHQKPDVKDETLKVYPILLAHGWPGSIVEFTRVIPLLTTPRKDRDFVFEVICPSIPGYGFSEAPHQPGFNVASAARIYAKLMTRLGIEKFFTHGGDWGSAITSTMAIVYPERVMGAHLTMLLDKMGLLGWIKYAVGNFYPTIFMGDHDAKKLYPFSDLLGLMLQESGYLHIQATKPDTVGEALTDSPAGLAAYILEKFSTWTDKEFRNLKDGGLPKKFTLDELLTNVMVYWSTNSIASSMRLYKETIASPKFNIFKLEKYPIHVPVGLANFPNEIFQFPAKLMSHNLKELVHYTDMPKGGHFPGMEQPVLLSDDIWKFVNTVQNLDDDDDEPETS